MTPLDSAKDASADVLLDQEALIGRMLAADPERQKYTGLLAPIMILCQKARADAEADRKSADRVALRAIADAPALIRTLSASGIPAIYLSQCSDRIALTIAQCAAAYALATWEWKSGITLLGEAMRFADGGEAKEIIEREIAAAKKNKTQLDGLTPIRELPSPSTTDGIGLRLCGASGRDPETKSYLATYCFVLFLIPVVPIRRYRVIRNEYQYALLGRAPLRIFDMLLPPIIWGSIVAGIHWLLYAS
ncbi:MAG: hypothetical protein WC712_12200 [Candidatus Brocadiia bacterium]